MARQGGGWVSYFHLTLHLFYFHPTLDTTDSHHHFNSLNSFSFALHHILVILLTVMFFHWQQYRIEQRTKKSYLCFWFGIMKFGRGKLKTTIISIQLNLCWVDVQLATVVLCQSSTYWCWWWPSDRFIDYDINVIFYKLFILILSHYYYLDNFMDLLFKIMILWIFLFCAFFPLLSRFRECTKNKCKSRA